MLRRNMSPPSSGSKHKPRKESLDLWALFIFRNSIQIFRIPDVEQSPQTHKSILEILVFHLLSAGFSICLSFNPEDGGNKLIRNVSRLSPYYMAVYPRSQGSS
jgi:hypothetical protein